MNYKIFLVENVCFCLKIPVFMAAMYLKDFNEFLEKSTKLLNISNKTFQINKN